MQKIIIIFKKIDLCAHTPIGLVLGLGLGVGLDSALGLVLDWGGGGTKIPETSRIQKKGR